MNRIQRSPLVMLVVLAVVLMGKGLRGDDPPLPATIDNGASAALAAATGETADATKVLAALAGRLEKYMASHAKYAEAKQAADDAEAAADQRYEQLKTLSEAGAGDRLPALHELLDLIVKLGPLRARATALEQGARARHDELRQLVDEAKTKSMNFSAKAKEAIEEVEKTLTPKPAGDMAGPRPAGEMASQKPAEDVTGPKALPENVPVALRGAMPRLRELSPYEFVDPLTVLPYAHAVPRYDDTANSINTVESLQNQTMLGPYFCDHRFPHAARFPLSTFGPGGELGEDGGLVIFEGMRFAIKDDGRYQVRFTAQTPAMPVTVRLQFTVKVGTTNYEVNLPPIRLPDEKNQPHLTFERTAVAQVVDGGMLTVHHEGHLPLRLEEVKAEAAKANASIAVLGRRGTARFGYGVDVP